VNTGSLTACKAAPFRRQSPIDTGGSRGRWTRRSLSWNGWRRIFQRSSGRPGRLASEERDRAFQLDVRRSWRHPQRITGFGWVTSAGPEEYLRVKSSVGEKEKFTRGDDDHPATLTGWCDGLPSGCRTRDHSTFVMATFRIGQRECSMQQSRGLSGCLDWSSRRSRHPGRSC